MSPKVTLEATIDHAGNVACLLACKGEKIKIIFTDTDVLVDVPEPQGHVASIQGAAISIARHPEWCPAPDTEPT